MPTRRAASSRMPPTVSSSLELVAWATKTDKVTRLLNSVLDRVLAHVP